MCAVLVWLLWGTPTAAHRLDEYLQATRLSLAPDSVDVEIDLTPGTAVASKIVAMIDTDNDGQLSEVERRAYASLVIGATRLDVDRRRVPLDLVDHQFPSTDDMRAGTGTIRLHARARARAGANGRHEVRYFNIHQPEIGVYLVNALVPPPGFEITAQHRDVSQREITVEYRVGDPAMSVTWPLAGGAVLMLLVTVASRRRSKF